MFRHEKTHSQHFSFLQLVRTGHNFKHFQECQEHLLLALVPWDESLLGELVSRNLLKCPHCNGFMGLNKKETKIVGERAAMLGVCGAIYHELQQQEQSLCALLALWVGAVVPGG